MSVHTIHSSEPGTAISPRAHDDGREGLLGTPAAAHGLGALALAAGYYATAQLGEALGFPNAPVSALWLPNALVMGALLIAPRRFWWFYLLAILPAHLIAQLPLPDVALLRVLTQYVLNCATALIGAFALAHFEPGTHRFDRVLPAWRLVFFGGPGGPFHDQRPHGRGVSHYRYRSKLLADHGSKGAHQHVRHPHRGALSWCTSPTA